MSNKRQGLLILHVQLDSLPGLIEPVMRIFLVFFVCVVFVFVLCLVLDYITTQISLSPIRRGFGPSL